MRSSPLAALVALVAGPLVGGCRSSSPAAAAPPGPAALASTTDDAACRAACLEPHAAAGAAYAAYCDELCAPATEPNADCVAGCARSHEPGAYYDDDGDYVEHDDERSAERRAADEAACQDECATVPTVSSDALAACVAACTDDDGNETSCAIACDPDPYDECRYTPCD